MFKIIYLPEALTTYIEKMVKAHETSVEQRMFCGRWKTREELEFFLENYHFFKHHQKKYNRDLIFARKDLPVRKIPLSKHLFEIMEFPDV
ncbi:MAG: hypothetical protein JHC33_04905 [Ignisphaera sp.]|nr:hypothetical protein [Ignisphaera sp.]